MYKFLSFESFITPNVLLICYYLGAVMLPLAAVLLVRKLVRLFPALGGAGEQVKAAIPQKDRMRIYLVMAVVFLCMEVVWRMMFETMIAYFQMREALVTLTV